MSDPTDADVRDQPSSEVVAREPMTPRRRRIERALVIGGAIVIAVLVRTLVVQTFWIPSGSMLPTLADGDRVAVNKLAYRIHDVHRGDVVVFDRPSALPRSTPAVLIKRVVAVGGDRVSIIEDGVTLNGRRIDEPYVHGLPTTPQVGCPITPPTDGIDTEAGFTVPAGTVLVLGDNRTGSTDGRCFGPIDVDTIVGQAEVVFWPPGHASRL